MDEGVRHSAAGWYPTRPRNGRRPNSVGPANRSAGAGARARWCGRCCRRESLLATTGRERRRIQTADDVVRRSGRHPARRTGRHLAARSGARIFQCDSQANLHSAGQDACRYNKPHFHHERVEELAGFEVPAVQSTIRTLIVPKQNGGLIQGRCCRMFVR
jgi:hypothetical protein